MITAALHITFRNCLRLDKRLGLVQPARAEAAERFQAEIESTPIPILSFFPSINMGGTLFAYDPDFKEGTDDIDKLYIYASYRYSGFLDF